MTGNSNDYWVTPGIILDWVLKNYGSFYDPCPLINPVGHDGLLDDWAVICDQMKKVVFCNPPYSDVEPWARKCMIESRRGAVCILLIYSKTDTQYWHKYVRWADEIIFLEGRLKFDGLTGKSLNPAKNPNCLIIFKPYTRIPQPRCTFMSRRRLEGKEM